MVLVQEQRGREKDDNFKAFSWDMQTIRNFKRYKGSVSSCPIMEVSLLAAVSFLECDK